MQLLSKLIEPWSLVFFTILLLALVLSIDRQPRAHKVLGFITLIFGIVWGILPIVFILKYGETYNHAYIFFGFAAGLLTFYSFPLGYIEKSELAMIFHARFAQAACILAAVGCMLAFTL